MSGPALLDANVLFPQLLRDVLISLAASRAFEARWTLQIHAEWTRNVLKYRPDISPATLDNVCALMNDNVPNCLVTGFEPLIESLILPDEGDRHVLAAAIHSQSKFLVTLNLKDFPAPILASYGVEAIAPDPFLLLILQDEPEKSLNALAKQRRRFKKPPLTPTEFLASLQPALPHFASALEPFQSQL